MASKKMQSEGIALLSMYNDEEDDKMEDVEEDVEGGMKEGERQEQDDGDVRIAEENLEADTDMVMVPDSANEATLPADNDGMTPEKSKFGTSMPQQPSVDMLVSQQDQQVVSVDSRRSRRGTVTIVDYGHDEVAMSPEPKRKINKFLEYEKAGKSFNAEVHNRKDYRKPDFLLHAVRYQDIDQIGSCFNKDVFDPHGYDPSDYYDEIEADMRRESDRKEQEKKKAQKFEFAFGGAQPEIAPGVPRVNVPVSGSTPSSGGLHLMPPTFEATNRDSRQNKKSKWDKVDGDRKNHLPFVGQDSVSTGGFLAAISSAANAGGRCMLFAQHKRREVEEKRSTERKERRS